MKSMQALMWKTDDDVDVGNDDNDVLLSTLNSNIYKIKSLQLTTNL